MTQWRKGRSAGTGKPRNRRARARSPRVRNTWRLLRSASRSVPLLRSATNKPEDLEGTVPMDERKFPYFLSVAGALVVFIGVTVLVMQDGAMDALNAIRAP